MNSIFIVLPILTLLMFDLGLTLSPSDFMLVARRPKAVVVGLAGQLVMLPLLAWLLVSVIQLPPVFAVGVLLIACCPGGSSSNIFSMLAGGDVALSVSLTALSSVITVFTIPVVMQLATATAGMEQGIELPVVSLVAQNIVSMLLPIALGIVCRACLPRFAQRAERVLSKLAFPALMLLAGVFFVQHYHTIADNFMRLGISITLMLLASLATAWLMATVTRLREQERRTIVIEVGMQNAAQAIAIASSPFVFNDGRMAIPAIIYALLMNVVLLTYVAFLRRS